MNPKHMEAAYHSLGLDRTGFLGDMTELARSFKLNMAKLQKGLEIRVDDVIERLADPVTAASLAQSTPLVVGSLVNSRCLSTGLKNGLKNLYPAQVLEKTVMDLSVEDTKFLCKLRGIGDITMVELLTIRHAETATNGFAAFKASGGKPLRPFTGPILSLPRPISLKKPGIENK